MYPGLLACLLHLFQFSVRSCSVHASILKIESHSTLLSTLSGERGHKKVDYMTFLVALKHLTANLYNKSSNLIRLIRIINHRKNSNAEKSQISSQSYLSCSQERSVGEFKTIILNTATTKSMNKGMKKRHLQIRMVQTSSLNLQRGKNIIKERLRCTNTGRSIQTSRNCGFYDHDIVWKVLGLNEHLCF